MCMLSKIVRLDNEPQVAKVLCCRDWKTTQHFDNKTVVFQSHCPKLTKLLTLHLHQMCFYIMNKTIIQLSVNRTLSTHKQSNVAKFFFLLPTDFSMVYYQRFAFHITTAVPQESSQPILKSLNATGCLPYMSYCPTSYKRPVLSKWILVQKNIF
jgi:hypothetical protein